MVFVGISPVTTDAYSARHGITLHGRNVCAGRVRKVSEGVPNTDPRLWRQKETVTATYKLREVLETAEHHVPTWAASSRVNAAIGTRGRELRAPIKAISQWRRAFSDLKLSHSPGAHIPQSDPAR